MTLQAFKEKFDKKYDGVTHPLLLEKGSVSDGQNMRKVSKAGGWKPRKGSTLLNTTEAEGGLDIKSIHQYTNPKHGDFHLITQINKKLLDNKTDVFEILTEGNDTIVQESDFLIWGEESADPLTQGTTLGSNILTTGAAVHITPGFSCVVDETFIYADGGDPPIVFGGNTPYCTGFLVWDASESTFIDYSAKATDGRDDTFAVIGSAAADFYLVGSPEIAEEIRLSFGSVVNVDNVTPTVYAWRAGAWADVTATDNTDTSETHDTNGTLTWARDATDSMKIIGNIMAYWYKVQLSGAITENVQIHSTRVYYDATTMTNKWDSTWQFPTNVLFFNGTEYSHHLGKLTSTSESTLMDISAANTSSYIYIKTAEPATGFGIAMVTDKVNSDAAVIDLIEVWTAKGWTTTGAGNIEDGTLNADSTKSFAVTGNIFFDATTTTPERRTLQQDKAPGYWYRISWDVALSATCQVYTVVYAEYPTALPKYEGCIEFDGSLYLWGDSEFPNRLRYSPNNRYDKLSGSDSGYTQAFGGADKVLNCLPIYEYLVIFKRKSVWLMGSDRTVKKITDKVGLASIKAARTAEIGISNYVTNRDEVKSVIIWQDVDGVYLFDGANVRKVSQTVDHYFNKEFSTAIGVDDITQLDSLIDPSNNEYHLLLSDVELIYNFDLDEWYPPFKRNIPLTCGNHFTGTNNRYYTVGGSDNGFFLILEDDTTDKTTGNADVAIEHKIKTRAITAQPEETTTFRFTLRKLWAELKARAAGSITTTLFKNMISTGVELSTPEAMSMIDATHDLTVPRLDLSEANTHSFQFEFSLNTADQEMEILSILYELDVKGEISI